MSATRPRRIVTRAVMVVAVVVLLEVGYVSAWIAATKASDYGTVSDAEFFLPVFRPLIQYADSDLPGGTALSDLWWLANRDKIGSRWIDLHVLGPETGPPEWLV